MLYTAENLKVMALRWLRSRHPDAVLMCEVGLGSWQQGGRLDVAAITEDGIVAVEIKGCDDSPARLELQGERYRSICQFVYLLAAPNISKRCSAARPMGWGELAVHGAELRESVEPYDLRRFNSPQMMWSMMWAHERKAAARGTGHASREVSNIVEAMSMSSIREFFMKAIRARNWRGGAYPKREVWLPGEELPPLGQPAAAEEAA